MSKVAAKPLRPDEERVRRSLEQDLGVPVMAHDDGSAPGMYDLEIRYPDRSAAPVEVSSTVSGELLSTMTQLEKKADGGWYPSTSLSRVWLVRTLPAVRVRGLGPAVEQHLQVLEAARVWRFHASIASAAAIAARLAGVLVSPAEAAQKALLGLGVLNAESYVPLGGRDAPGFAVTVHGGGGSWGGTAEAVVDWIMEFVRDGNRTDNLTKLASASAGEAHLAVTASISGVDFAVWRAVEDTDGSGVVPRTVPILPSPLTHLWLFSPGGPTGLAWQTGVGWRRFACAPWAS